MRPALDKTEKTNHFSQYNKYGTKFAKGGKEGGKINLQTGRFDNIDSAVIISSLSKVVHNFQFQNSPWLYFYSITRNALTKQKYNC